MARLSDHDQRDAEHALRAEITILLAKYARRMLAQGKAYIVEEIGELNKKEGDVDGTAVGRAAAERVKAEYFRTTSPQSAIDTAATAAPQLEGGLERGVGIGESACPDNLCGL